MFSLLVESNEFFLLPIFGLVVSFGSTPTKRQTQFFWVFVTIDESTLTDYVTHIPQLLLEFTLGVVWSVGLDKRIHHYRIIQSIFIGMKILCAQPIPPLSPNPWNPDPFTVSILLPFPKCHQGNYTVCSLFKSDSFT